MDGDSGLEHSADDDHEQSGDDERLSEDGAGRSIHSEDLDDDQVDVDLNGTLSEVILFKLDRKLYRETTTFIRNFLATNEILIGQQR